MLERRMVQDVDGHRAAVTMTVTDWTVTWTYWKESILVKKIGDTCFVDKLPYRQVLGAQVTSLQDEARLSLHYVKVIVSENTSVVLRQATVSFLANDVICNDVSKRINESLRKSESHRPRRVLIFMNPIAGWKDSVKSYNRTVKPLFDKAGVTVHAVVTKNENHAPQVLAEYDLSTIDAVLSMGGDGSYGHVFNGLMQKAIKDTGADMNDESVEPATPPVAFGVLPTGSGCAVAFRCTSCIDLETSALSAILGKTQPGDAGAIRRSDDSLVRYQLFVSSTGWLANAFAWLDELRCFRKARYSLMFVALWWWFVFFDVEIQYMEVPPEHRTLQSQKSFESVGKNNSCSTVDGPLPGWKTFRGTVPGFTFVNSLMMRYFKWKSAMPYRPPKLSSGAFQLMIFKSQNFYRMMHIMAMDSERNQPSEIVSRDICESIDVTELRFRVGCHHPSLLSVFIDGEPYALMDYKAKIHARKFNMLVIDDDLVSEALSNAK